MNTFARAYNVRTCLYIFQILFKGNTNYNSIVYMNFKQAIKWYI